MRFLILPEVKHQEMVVFIDIILHEYSLCVIFILLLYIKALFIVHLTNYYELSLFYFPIISETFLAPFQAFQGINVKLSGYQVVSVFSGTKRKSRQRPDFV